MQTTGDNYYDIPDDELPSANFAARPTSEISDLGLLDIDGLSTFLSFAASSSSSATESESESAHKTTDAEKEDYLDNSTTPTARSPVTSQLMPRPEMPRTPPDTPAITVTSPSKKRQSLIERFRSVSDVAAKVRRSSMRLKADTAPPGAFATGEFTPQVPRRAMSARLDRKGMAKGRHSRHLSSDSDLKARKVLGLQESVWEEERPQLDGGHFGGSDEGYLEGNDEENFEGSDRGNLEGSDGEGVQFQTSHSSASFSRKPRVRETLEKKHLSRLRMDFVASEPEQLVESPHSMLDTPQELYAVPELLPQPGRFRPTSAIHGRRGTSTPVSPTTPSPLRRTQPAPYDRIAGDEDFEDLHLARVYVPGHICLEKHPALLRKDSVATLDAFAGEMDSIGRRPSDLMALEQIVVYFDGMGLIEEATDECLDRYWLTPPQQAVQETEPDVMDLEQLSPRSQQSGSCSHSRSASSTLSRFSFSSASSGADAVPQGSPQKRQLIRLRRLLSPALPGMRGPEG